LLSVIALAQALPSANKPTFHVGDYFLYCDYDLRTNEKKGCHTLEYIEGRNIGTGSGEHIFQRKEMDSGATSEVRLTEQLATRFRGLDGATFEPHNYTFEFPFQVGSRWRGQYDIRFEKDPSRNQNRTKTAEVVGYEDVKVPAGDFKAFKIKYDNWRNERGVTRPADEVVYFCPDLGVWCLYESEALGSVRTRLVEVRRGTAK
jgi:hypothetical protein